MYFDFPITEETLQREFERIARDSKQPEVLEEIFKVLKYDPNLIAEVFIRDVLVKRVIQSAYYESESLHKELMEKAKREYEKIKSANDLKNLNGIYKEIKIFKGKIKKL